MTALEQAIDVKAIHPHTKVTILYHELHLPNGDRFQEEFREAHKLGVEFVHFTPPSYPEVGEEFIMVKDGINGVTHNLPYDRLVLTTLLNPQSDAGVIARMLKLTQDENGFFFDRRLRLRPEEHIERGIYVCGAAHYPTGWQEAEFQAASAALNAIHHIKNGASEISISTTYVDEEECTGCGTCISQCPFDAISMCETEGVLDVALIHPTLCVGCGNCVVVCPVKAIRHPLEGDAQILAEIEEALTTTSSHGQHRLLVFCCEWSGQIAADIAGSRKLLYPPEVRPIHMSCSARFDPIHALWGFLNGADGILVTACPPGHCHYINGNRHMFERVDALRTLLTEHGFDSRRLRLVWIKPDNPREFVSEITAFTKLVKALGLSSHRRL
ncbi:MAG: hydrogenase iron-sulfur subunit [Anaerolineales bacterium]|nr:hydrogenase iron-sulfur subunit [Anaerolineales bacterium]